MESVVNSMNVYISGKSAETYLPKQYKLKERSTDCDLIVQIHEYAWQTDFDKKLNLTKKQLSLNVKEELEDIKNVDDNDIEDGAVDRADESLLRGLRNLAVINKSVSTRDYSDLPLVSKSWLFPVQSVHVENNKLHVFFVRQAVFKYGLVEVLNSGRHFGNTVTDANRQVEIVTDDISSNLMKANLQDLRIHLLANFAKKLLEFVNIKTYVDEKCSIKMSKSPKNDDVITVLCGPVLDENNEIGDHSAVELYKRKSIDMRLTAEHKKGLRVTSIPAWEEFFWKLGSAAVTIDMLKIRHARPIKVFLDRPIEEKKGACFIMYNSARLAKLIRDFNARVDRNIYPSLPQLDSIDVTLFQESEEWDMFYMYVLKFPIVLQNIFRNIANGELHSHSLVSYMLGLASTFSMYYRRVKILTEPRDHLMAKLHARIYLLQAVQQIFLNCFDLLDIEPVNQM